jgi:hypothetical protein
MERAQVALAVLAVRKNLELAQIFVGPVHAEPQRITLVADQAQPLAA